jgi:integrase
MAWLIKRGKTYYVCYRIGKKEYRRSCKTTNKWQATLVKKAYEKIELEQQHSLPNSAVFTVAEYCELYLKDTQASDAPSWHKNKQYFLRRSILPFFGDLNIRAISPIQVNQYIIQRQNERKKPKTINNELAILSAMLHHAEANKYIAPGQVPKIKKLKVADKRLRFLSHEEIERLIQALQDFSGDVQAYVMLMLYCGLRSGEAAHTRWVDIDWEKRQLFVTPREDWQPKNKRIRMIPITQRLYDFLEWRRNCADADPELVTCQRGDRYYEPCVRKVMKKAGLETTGPNKVTAHTLRHTFASHLVMAGVPLYSVSQMLGHSSISITEIYAHLAPSHLQEAASALTY